MESNAKKRKAILKRNLKTAGIRNLTSIEESYTFTIETITGINLNIIAELTETALIMTGTLDIEVNVKDKSIMSTLGEYLHRVNSGMTLSMFELDYEEGEIWFSASARYYNVFPESEAYNGMIKNISYIVDSYSRGIVDIATGNCKDAKSAYDNSQSSILKILTNKHIAYILNKLIPEKCTDNDIIMQSSLPVSLSEDVTFSKEFISLLKHIKNNEDDNT